MELQSPEQKRNPEFGLTALSQPVSGISLSSSLWFVRNQILSPTLALELARRYEAAASGICGLAPLISSHSMNTISPMMAG